MNKEELQMAVALRDYSNVPSQIPWEIVRELLMEQAIDKNSSTFREGITARVMGYEQSGEKLGYDVVGHAVEIKPQNIYLDKGGRLNAGGQFTDFTFERHDKYLRDDVMMGVSGFVDGELAFILKFPYELLSNRVVQQLNNKITRDGNRYCRSASFSFCHYEAHPDQIEVVYVSPRLDEMENHIQKKLYTFLRDQQQVMEETKRNAAVNRWRKWRQKQYDKTRGVVAA